MPACKAAGLVLLLLAAVSCGAQEQTAAPPERTAAQRLVRGLELDPDSNHVSVDIDSAVLAQLAAERGAATTALEDPLTAARLFADAVGLDPDAQFEMIERAPDVGEGSGMFTATVDARDGQRVVRMRLVSDPDAQGRPTVWVLNDYREERDRSP